MHESRTVVGDVPLRVRVPDAADRVLLLGHGGGHGKDTKRFVALARRYADGTGMAVACIDAVDHGERRPAGATDDLPAGWHSRTGPQMARDWQATAVHVESIGPAVAYVGFSMGALFGLWTVAALPSITAAVFVSGGIPSGEWIDDPPLAAAVLDAAGSLDHAHVLMLNMAGDALFPAADVHRLFDAVSATSKDLRFRDGGHDDWAPALIDESIAFVNQHA